MATEAQKKRKKYDTKEATRELRRREYDRIRAARIKMDEASGEISDALVRLEYLLNDRKGD